MLEERYGAAFVGMRRNGRSGVSTILEERVYFRGRKGEALSDGAKKV
jgi:hypothetical protein